MASIWDDAIDDALNKKQRESEKENKDRKQDSVILAELISRVMRMYKEYTPTLWDENPKVEEILEKSGVDDDIWSLTDGPAFDSLINVIKNSITTETYEENYEIALELFSICLDFYIDPEKFENSLRIWEFMDKFSDPKYNYFEDEEEQKIDEDEILKFSNYVDARPIYYKSFTKKEYLHHLAFLEKLKNSANKLGFSNIGGIIESKIKSLREYYFDETRFKQNSVDRGFSENPKDELKAMLYDDLREFLSSNYSIIPSNGAFEYDLVKTKNDPTNKDADKLMKDIIKYFYEQILEELLKMDLPVDTIKYSALETEAEQLREFLKSLIDVIDTRELEEYLNGSNGFDRAIRAENLNWAGTGSVIEQVKGEKHRLSENLS